MKQNSVHWLIFPPYPWRWMTDNLTLTCWIRRLWKPLATPWMIFPLWLTGGLKLTLIRIIGNGWNLPGKWHWKKPSNKIVNFRRWRCLFAAKTTALKPFWRVPLRLIRVFRMCIWLYCMTLPDAYRLKPNSTPFLMRQWKALSLLTSPTISYPLTPL